MNKTIIPSTILLAVLIAMPSIMLLLGPAEQQTTPIQQTDPLKAKIEIPLKAGYTLTVRGPDGSIKQTYSDVPHSPTANLNRLIKLYWAEGRKNMFNLRPEYAQSYWFGLPTEITTCRDPGHVPGNYNPAIYGGMVVQIRRRYDGTFGPKQLLTHTTRIYVGNQYVDASNKFCATRAYGADASVSIQWNTTHAWLTVSASIPIVVATTVSNVTWTLRLDHSLQTQPLDNLRCPYGPTNCAWGGWTRYVPGVYSIIWNDVITPPLSVASGDTVDVSYVFYIPIPMSVNLVSMLASLLQTQPAPGSTLTNLIDTAGIVYVNHLPATGAPMSGMLDPEGLAGVEIFAPSSGSLVSALVWPALYIGWGTGVAVSPGSTSPPNLVNKIGEREASVSLSPSRLSFSGVIDNPTGSPITVTEIAFMVGDSSQLQSSPTTWYYITSICPYDMITQPNGPLNCGKRLVLVYLPINPGLTVPPGKAYKVELDLVFTPLP
jgi:hypothetical protein